MFVRNTLCAAAMLALAAAGTAAASTAGVQTGQFNLGGIQQICLKGNHTMYGTTFVWSGHWKDSPATGEKAAVWANYQSTGAYYGYYNDTITIKAGNKADWYDYTDDDSYAAFLPDQTFTFVKKVCDPAAAVISKTRKAVTQ